MMWAIVYINYFLFNCEAHCFGKEIIGREPITIIVCKHKSAIEVSSSNGSSSPTFEMTHLHMEALACQLLGPWPSLKMTVRQTCHINTVIPLGCVVWVWVPLKPGPVV